MTPTPTRRERERGSAAPLELILGAGLLLLPVAAALAVLPTWAERQSAARLAAQEAARTIATAATWQAGVAAADVIAAQVIANHGMDPADLHIDYAGSLSRVGRVTATATITIPAIVLPGLGQVAAASWTVVHREPVDVYRSFP